MRIGRVLLIVGLILFIGALAVGGLLLWRNRAATPQTSEMEEGTPPPPAAVSMAQIVVAAQNIPRGMRVAEEDNAVIVQSWPIDAMPAGAINDLDDVYDRITRVDIVLGMPILEDMLTEQAWDLGATGSDAALQVPPGLVGYAVPVARYSSAGWALRPGDHVDVLISLLMLDIDEEFQTITPNNATCLPPFNEEGCGIDVYGRLEVLPNGVLVNVTPIEAQRPRLVTQLTVQDVLVLQVGDWPKPEAVSPEGEVIPIEQPAEGEEVAPPEPEVQAMTVAVTRQDAMVLEFGQAVGARFTFVLRSAGDAETVATESVTLQYLMDRFGIEEPPKLPLGVTPPLSRLEPIGRTETAGHYGTGSGAGAAAGGE